jgi:hypothetical protein
MKENSYSFKLKIAEVLIMGVHHADGCVDEDDCD